MSTVSVVDPKALVVEHVATLREYAKRVLLRQGSLTPLEEDDRASRLREFLAIGSSFKLTHREMVVLLFRGLMGPKPGMPSCGCPTCRERQASSY
jgi:hypothetical protein